MGWRGLTRFVLTVFAAVLLSFLPDPHRPARAESESIVIDLSMSGLAAYGDFLRQAEARVSNEINRQFSQNAALSEVEVVVVGDRHGEIVPILKTTVSRAQWQETPRVGAWTEYYSSAYALLQRHPEQTIATVADVPVRATANPQSTAAEIDQAFDEGRLTGTAAQQYLDQLD